MMKTVIIFISLGIFLMFGSLAFADLKGDVSGDGDMTLADAILTLQICTGLTPSSNVHKQADINEDGKIGIEEAIYVLQCVARVMQGPHIDNDYDGYTENQGDCNDDNQTVHPGATEICNNVDDDCDGEVDEDVKNTYYRDADADGYGNPSNSTQECSQPSGYVANSADCDDNDGNEHPNQTWYKDSDGDGYSNGVTNTTSCTRPSGYRTASELTSATGDCNDNKNSIHPGAIEICGDNTDNDCDGKVDEGCGNCCSISQGEWDFTLWQGNIIFFGLEGYFRQSGCNFYLTDDPSFSGPLNGCHWIVEGDGLVIEGDFFGNPATSFEGTWSLSGHSGRVVGNKM